MYLTNDNYTVEHFFMVWTVTEKQNLRITVRI